jgi:ribosomal protein S27AE
MKNNSPCPKCGGTDILHLGDERATPYANVVLTGATVLSAVQVHRYVCCDCGYSEEWFEKEDISQLRKKAN